MAVSLLLEITFWPEMNNLSETFFREIHQFWFSGV